jgi:hypothetical protein
MQSKNEKGLAHIAVIVLILAVVAAAGLAGWYVWERNQKDTKQTSNSNTQSQVDPTEGGKFLVIKEWGVRFELPEELRGDVYYRIGRNDITKLERTLFASSKLDSLLGDFSCSFKENPQIDGLSAGLLRLAPEYQPAPDYIADNLNELGDLEGYEYFTTKPAELTCGTAIGGNDIKPGLYDAEQKISKDLREAFTTLEKIQ